jgi:hypothetical protein
LVFIVNKKMAHREAEPWRSLLPVDAGKICLL